MPCQQPTLRRTPTVRGGLGGELLWLLLIKLTRLLRSLRTNCIQTVAIENLSDLWLFNALATNCEHVNVEAPPALTMSFTLTFCKDTQENDQVERYNLCIDSTREWRRQKDLVDPNETMTEPTPSTLTTATSWSSYVIPLVMRMGTCLLGIVAIAGGLLYVKQESLLVRGEHGG
jgi:hypothetical protein